jgi:carboxypeptidase D
MFFWQVEQSHTADRSRLVIWLNGGPGCSSEDGALLEIGPYRIHSGGKLERNPGSWNEYATLLFVDNPVGTGYSYTSGPDGYVRELEDGATQFIKFLEEWFKIFPEFNHDDVSASYGEFLC